MPAAAPVPAPAAPANPGIPASAGSGTIPASGQSGALSGPWAIEEQGMTIFYNRAPEPEQVS